MATYYVRLRKGGASGRKVGEFGPFTTQKLAIKQGHALMDAGLASGVTVAVEKKGHRVKAKTTKRKRNAGKPLTLREIKDALHSQLDTYRDSEILGGIIVEVTDADGDVYSVTTDGMSVRAAVAAIDNARRKWDLFDPDVQRSRKRKRNRGPAPGVKTKQKWLQRADKSMERRGTVGAFTKQARARGYKNTMEFARKVMAGWRSGKKTVYNKKTRKQSRITTQLMQRANFAINAQSRRNPRGGPVVWGGSGGVVWGQIKGTHDAFSIDRSREGAKWVLKFYKDGQEPGTILASGTDPSALQRRGDRFWRESKSLHHKRNPRPGGGKTVSEASAGGVNIMDMGRIWDEHSYPYPSRGKRIDKIRWIVDHHTRKKIDGSWIDGSSASVIVQVYDALSPANQEQYGAMKAPQMAGLAWELLAKQRKGNPIRLPTKRNAESHAVLTKAIPSGGFGRALTSTEIRKLRAAGVRVHGRSLVLRVHDSPDYGRVYEPDSGGGFTASSLRVERNWPKATRRNQARMPGQGRTPLRRQRSSIRANSGKQAQYRAFISQRIPKYRAQGLSNTEAMSAAAADWRKLKGR